MRLEPEELPVDLNEISGQPRFRSESVDVTPVTLNFIFNGKREMQTPWRAECIFRVNYR